MRRTVIAISALLAAAALGALAAGSIAGGERGRSDGPVIAADRELGPLQVVPANPPRSESRSTFARKGKSEQKLEFFQTPEPLEIASQTEEAATLPCPKGYRAINGYFVTGRQGTFLDLNAPELAVPPGESEPATKPSKRNWVVGVFNATEQSDQVVFGVACLNKLK